MQTFGEKYQIEDDGKHRPNGMYAGYFVTYVPYSGAERVRLLIPAGASLILSIQHDLKTR